MRPEDLSGRLHALSVQILVLVAALPHTIQSRGAFDQVCRAAPNASDNYRSACRGRSRKEFVARLGVAVDEADETVRWLEVIRDARLAPDGRVIPLLKEAIELRAILAASHKTSKRNLRELDAKRRNHGKRRPNQ